MARVRIVKLPKALVGAETMNPGLYGTNGNNQFSFNRYLQAGKMSEEPIEARQTLGPVDREDANLEAEKGETAVVNIDGIPAHFNIAGKRHSQGGTPLNLPDNSFIFSDTAKMKIKDPVVLAQFGMAPKKGGYTPAEISKKYNVNKFRKILADPNSEDLDRKTAEIMIANYNEKLAKLSLAQESIKGFPQGIPVIAMPYIESMEIDPSTFLPDQAQGQLEEGAQPDTNTGEARYGANVISQWDTKRFGGIPKAQDGINWAEDADVGPYYRKYMEALNSKDPVKMKEVSAQIGNTDIENSLSWWPGSKQNKLADLSQILEKQATAYERKVPSKVTTEEQLDMNARKNAAEAFTKAYQLKQQAKQAGDPDAEILYDDMLKELHKVHPNYIAAQGYRQERQKSDPYYSSNVERSNPKPALYYSDKQKELIADYHNKLVTTPKEVAKVNEKLAAEKKAAEKKIEKKQTSKIEQPPIYASDLTPEERAFLGL